MIMVNMGAPPSLSFSNRLTTRGAFVFLSEKHFSKLFYCQTVSPQIEIFLLLWTRFNSFLL